MIELDIQTPDLTPPTRILRDVVDVDISELIGLDDLNVHCLMVDNISNRLWNRVIILDEPLEFVDKWWVPLIRDQYHLYVHLHIPVSTFYTRGSYASFIVSSHILH